MKHQKYSHTLAVTKTQNILQTSSNIIIIWSFDDVINPVSCLLELTESVYDNICLWMCEDRTNKGKKRACRITHAYVDVMRIRMYV